MQHSSRITQSTIRGWILSQKGIESFSLSKKSKRVAGAGRKPLLIEFDDVIADVIRSEEEKRNKSVVLM